MGRRTLVIGATGRIGRKVVRYLAEQEQPVRVFVRDAERAKRMFGSSASLDIAVGDITQPETITAALKDVHHVFLLVGGAACLDPANEIHVVRAARAASVERLVKVSGGPPITSADSESPVGRAHWQVEQELLKGAPWATILRPGLFAPLLFQRVFASTFVDVGSGAVSYVDTGDIARVAAVTLTSSGHEGKTYQVTGGRAASPDEVYEAIQRVTGPLTRKRVPASEAAPPDRVPPWYLPHVTAVLRHTGLGDYSLQTDVVQSITKKPPLEMAEFVVRNARIFQTLAAGERRKEEAVRALADTMEEEQTAAP